MSPTGASTPEGGNDAGRRFRYLPDIALADVAFEAWGATIEELFSAAADATTGTMAADLEAIEERQRRVISLEEPDVDLLLLRFLGELVYFKDAEGLLLRVPVVRILRRENAYLLEAEARGEPIDPLRHRLQADVKAVTLHRLRVERTARGWEASVVLDI